MERVVDKFVSISNESGRGREKEKKEKGDGGGREKLQATVFIKSILLIRILTQKDILLGKL